MHSSTKKKINTDEQLDGGAVIGAAFDKFDRDRSGQVDAAELSLALRYA